MVCPYVVYLGAKCILSYDKYVSYKGLLVDIFSLVNYVDGEEGGVLGFHSAKGDVWSILVEVPGTLGLWWVFSAEVKLVLG